MDLLQVHPHLSFLASPRHINQRHHHFGFPRARNPAHEPTRSCDHLNQMLSFFSVDCGQNVTTDECEITTPYYDTQYSNNLDCAWTISVDTEQKDLSRKFTSFDLEESASCTHDYVEIRNGKDKAAPLIGNNDHENKRLEIQYR